MTIASNLSLNHTILPAAAKTATTPPPVAPMTRSLWRHTQNEDAAHDDHGLAARTAYAIIGTLGLGSVGYALWQTWALMAGSHLQDAVAAFAR